MTSVIRSFLIFLNTSLLLSNCSTTESYKLSEILPEYSNLEGKPIDPLKKKPMLKPQSNIPKYDQFFSDSKKIILKIKLGFIILSGKADELEINSNDRVQFIQKFTLEFPELEKEIKSLLDRAKKLSTEASNDFTGLQILKLPQVTGDLIDTIKDLNELIGEFPKIKTALDQSNTRNAYNVNSQFSQKNKDTNYNVNQNESNSSVSKSYQSTYQGESRKGEIIPEYSNSTMTEQRLENGRLNLTKFQEYLFTKVKK